MDASLETLLEPLRHSPRLVEVVDALERQLADERARRRRFYAEMTPEEKIEFIDGEVVLHSPARNRHLDATKHILKLMDTHVTMHRLGTVKAEKCLCVFPRNDYEADVVFFGPEKSAGFTEETLQFPIPDLAVEVLSKLTEARDRGVKFEDYAAHGVGEYWIVDPEAGVVEQYLLRSNGAYELQVKASTGLIRSAVVPGFEAEIGAFFDAEKNLAWLRRILGASNLG